LYISHYSDEIQAAECQTWCRYELSVSRFRFCPQNSLFILLVHIHGESLARGPKLLSMHTVELRGFLVRKYWQTGSFKACQTAFRTEFGERRAQSKCRIQKLVKKLETRRSRSNACRLLSLGGLLKGKMYKNTPRTIEQLKDAIHQEIQAVNVDTLGKVFQNLKKRIPVCLDVKRRPVSASIMSRFCFASFPVCVYKFSSHYLNNIIFY